MINITFIRFFKTISFIFIILLSTQVFSMDRALEDEISFVKKSFNDYGFLPEQEGIIAYRGDSRSPKELMESGGFFRKAFGDTSKIPSFRVDGGVRHMIGLSRDLTVAMGFARYNVNVQRETEKPQKEGWVYAVYLQPGLYYDPVKYPHAFLADWGREVDAIYVPAEHIIGAIKVSTEESLCIHCYLHRIPQELHCIRGCMTPYVNQFTLSVSLWISNGLSTVILEEEMVLPIDQLSSIYDAGHYTVVLNSDDTDEAQRIAAKYRNYFPVTKAHARPDKDLTASLLPGVDILYVPEIL